MDFEKSGCPDVVVTAGGTREKIDDVRYIGNFSGGRLGRALAAEYARLGHSVLLLAPTDSMERLGLPEGVEHQPFTSAENLQELMCAIPAARLVLHAAAVADYTPQRVEGKLSSDEEELTLTLRRTPKILQGLREHFGDNSMIVGFKLISGVAETELIDAATKQIAACNTDLCFANDLQCLQPWRELHIVDPDGAYRTILGDTQTVARALANCISIEGKRYEWI
ncbi:MAG: phosphopantothenoylcysteine decarboxylase [Candidatus Saccharimonadales bacterium]